MKNLYEGCTIRGLPVGIPFKTRFSKSDGKGSSFLKDAEVFIIVSYKSICDKSKNKYVDIVPQKLNLKKVQHEGLSVKERIKQKLIADSKKAGGKSGSEEFVTNFSHITDQATVDKTVKNACAEGDKEDVTAESNETQRKNAEIDGNEKSDGIKNIDTNNCSEATQIDQDKSEDLDFDEEKPVDTASVENTSGANVSIKQSHDDNKTAVQGNFEIKTIKGKLDEGESTDSNAENVSDDEVHVEEVFIRGNDGEMESSNSQRKNTGLDKHGLQMGTANQNEMIVPLEPESQNSADNIKNKRPKDVGVQFKSSPAKRKVIEESAVEDFVEQPKIKEEWDEEERTDSNNELVSDDEVNVEDVFIRTYGSDFGEIDSSYYQSENTGFEMHGLQMDTANKNETNVSFKQEYQMEDTDYNQRKKKKRKKQNDFGVQFEPSPVKRKVIEEPEADCSGRRKSGRIRSIGYRPDYAAMEKKPEMVFYSSDDVSDDLDEVEETVAVAETEVDDNKDPDFDPQWFETTVNTVKEEDGGNADEEQEAKGSSATDSETDSELKKTKKPNMVLVTPVPGTEKIFRNKRGKYTKKRKNLKIVESIEKKPKPIKPKLPKSSIKVNNPKIKPRKMPRIKVSLAEHPDKYRVDKMESFARKDRGKSKEEVLVEVMICTLCDEFSSSSSSVMEQHIEQHLNKDLDCDHCEYVARSISELRQHRRTEHKVNLHICFVCGEEFFTLNSYRKHLGLVHDEPQYACKICLKSGEENKRFTTQQLLNEHSVECHPGTVPMCVCECGKRLFESYLAEHKKNYCRKTKVHEFTCEVCGKTFTSSSVMIRHKNVVHNNMRTHKCIQCSFVASNSSRLRFHMLVHQGCHQYRCDQCDFSCIQQYQLKSHMRTHTGFKPYKCEQCKYAAAWKVQLKEHMKAHSSAEAVTCEACGILFKSPKTLALHTKKEHDKASTVSIN